jgi:hypothetical protein
MGSSDGSDNVQFSLLRSTASARNPSDADH